MAMGASLGAAPVVPAGEVSPQGDVQASFAALLFAEQTPQGPAPEAPPALLEAFGSGAVAAPPPVSEDGLPPLPLPPVESELPQMPLSPAPLESLVAEMPLAGVPAGAEAPSPAALPLPASPIAESAAAQEPLDADGPALISRARLAAQTALAGQAAPEPRGGARTLTVSHASPTTAPASGGGAEPQLAPLAAEPAPAPELPRVPVQPPEPPPVAPEVPPELVLDDAARPLEDAEFLLKPDASGDRLALRSDAGTVSARVLAGLESHIETIDAVRKAPGAVLDARAQLAERARAADVLNQVRVVLTPELREATVQLSPASLGRVAIHLMVDDESRLNAEMRVETSEALSAVSRHLPELKAILQERGLEVDSFDLSLGLEQEEGEEKQPSDPQQGRSPSKSSQSTFTLTGDPDEQSTVAGSAPGIDFYA